jgi:hypothetical protein
MWMLPYSLSSSVSTSVIITVTCGRGEGEEDRWRRVTGMSLIGGGDELDQRGGGRLVGMRSTQRRRRNGPLARGGGRATCGVQRIAVKRIRKRFGLGLDFGQWRDFNF